MSEEKYVVAYDIGIAFPWGLPETVKWAKILPNTANNFLEPYDGTVVNVYYVKSDS